MAVMYVMKLCCLFVITGLLCSVLGEEYNLFGEAGQAYSLEINLGHPRQRLYVIVDTGSTTLAVAAYPRPDHDVYFHAENSTTLIDSGKKVQAEYSQGNWIGRNVSDFVDIPSLNQHIELRSDFAVITKSEEFFMNGSGWQGLLGLAYLPIGAWGDQILVGSWLDSLESYLNKQFSFELKLCGVQSATNSTHYGKFSMIDDMFSKNTTPYQTPILHKRWYEVGVLAINVRHPLESRTNPHYKISMDQLSCLILNEHKSIVDSGTTNIRLPDGIYSKVLYFLRQHSKSANILILDEFWYHGEAACWPEPQDWVSLPWLDIDLLSNAADDQYFTLEIPPVNYMRVVSAQNSSDNGGVSQFCYKLGVEASGIDTVLGYTAMEGLNVIFNRSGGWIGWESSDCGPNARVSGPYTSDDNLINLCRMSKSDSEVATSIRAAQWTLCAISIIAAIVLIYLLAPCVRSIIVKRRQRAQSMSDEALVEQELS